MSNLVFRHLTALLVSTTGLLPSSLAMGDVVLVNPAPHDAFDTAGLQADDVLERWTFRNANGVVSEGRFDSPFDVSAIQTLYGAFGGVEIVYRRKDAKHKTVLHRAGWWNGELRPNWAPATEATIRALLDKISKGNFTAAKDLEGLARQRSDGLESAWVLHRTASALARKKAIDAALRLRSLAVKAADRVGHKHAAAWLVQAGAIETFVGGRPADGIVRLKEALRRREAIPDNSIAVSITLNNLCISTSQRADYATARRYCKRAYLIRNAQIPNHLLTAESLHTIGNIELWSGNLDEAAKHYRQALAIRQLKDPRGKTVGRTFAMLAVLAQRRGHLDEADEASQRSLSILIEKKSTPTIIANIYRIQGWIAQERRRYGDAERLYLKSLSIGEKNRTGPVGLSATLSSLASLAQQRGNDEAAEHYAQRAHKLIKKLDPKGTRILGSLRELGRIALRRGRLDEADDYFRQGLNVLKAMDAPGFSMADIIASMGHVARRRGHIDKTRALYTEAFELMSSTTPNRLAGAEILTHLGALSRESGAPEAETQLRRALDLGLRLAPGTLYEVLPRYELGLLQRDRGELGPAIDSLAAAISALESQRDLIGQQDSTAVGFAEQYARIFKTSINLLVDAGRTDEAFLMSERYRARSLLSVLRHDDFRKTTPDVPGELQEERVRLNREYGIAYRAFQQLDGDADAKTVSRTLERLKALRVRRHELAEQLHRFAPRMAAWAHPSPIGPRQVGAVLEKGTVVLSYIVLEDRVLLFSQQQGDQKVSVSKLPVPRETLEDQVETFRVLVRSPDAGPESVLALRSLSARLYAALVEPALSRISGASRLLILADGPLHLLPFSALVTAQDEQRARYLIEDYVLHTAASMSVLSELKRSPDLRPSETDLIAFGDPIYPDANDVDEGRFDPLRGRQLSSLPSSRREVLDIANLFQDRAQVFLGREAREEKVKSIPANTRFVHFASHGILDPSAPTDSFLALSMTSTRTSSENGLLQAWEILEQLQWNAELVTLSACDTGLGRQAGGEGLIGLTRAFLAAGARAVVASMWAVPDRPTAPLMVRFYEALKDGTRKDEALRTAQLMLLREPVAVPNESGSTWGARLLQWLRGPPKVDASHPYYWAAFQLYGDAR